MKPLALLAVLVLAGCGVDPLAPFRAGVPEGREAVRRLREAEDLPDSVAARGWAQQAADVLIEGLATPDVRRETQAALWHTLGRARVLAGAFAEADSAYAEALARADAPRQRARYAADAGTAALLAGDPGRALPLLRRALVLDPSDAAARRNYEIAQRAVDQDAEPEPSDFARQVKARADSLVAARQYPAALDVMREGLAQDSSVAAYADFTQRLGGVVQIETSVPAGDRPADRAPSTAVDSFP